jgi:hypothetical protein
MYFFLRERFQAVTKYFHWTVELQPLNGKLAVCLPQRQNSFIPTILKTSCFNYPEGIYTTTHTITLPCYFTPV